MIKFSSKISLFLILWVVSTANAALPNSAVPTLAPMLDKVLPGVVNISTKSVIQVRENPLFNDPFFRRFFDIPDRPRERQTQSLGSGVIVNASKGYIITNNHVIDKADEITVTLRDGRSFIASVIGKDPEADLAVIKIKANKLTEVPLANSDKINVGDFVVAIGNPFGLGQTVTSGIVSALSRSGLGIEGYEDFIQTDASINPGNSGGALVDLNGKLVGINTAIVGPSGGNVGIGFAIPSNMAKDIMQQLIRFGEVKRGHLGVAIQTLTPDLAEAFGIGINRGVIINQVISGSPAHKAGMRPGDVVTHVDNKLIKTESELRNAIGLKRIGTKVKLSINRGGKAKTIFITIAENKRTKVSGNKLHKRLTGAHFVVIDKYHPLAGQVQGVEIVDVLRGSPAWRLGLRKGDVVDSINRRDIKNMGQFRKLLKNRGRIVFRVLRRDGAFFVAIQ